MNRSLIATVFLISTAISTYADDLRKRAEENPLDCTVYLASKGAISRFDFEWVLLELGRYDDLLRLTDTTDSYCVTAFSSYSLTLIEKNNIVGANRFLDPAMEFLRKNEDHWDDESALKLPRRLAFLRRENDISEILEHQTEDSGRVEALVNAGLGYQESGQNEKAVAALSAAWELGEFPGTTEKIDLARSYMVLGENRKALEVLDLLEKENERSSTENRGAVFLRMVPLYIKLGELEKASQLWVLHRDVDDPYDTFSYASALFIAGYDDKAGPFLLHLRSDKEFLNRYRNELTDLYLRRGDIEAARTIAVFPSPDEDDNYYQQEALMSVADKAIADGDRVTALKFVDLAYKRAKRVGEEHHARDSTSPLIRKAHYLREIRRRYFKLGLFENGLAVARAIKVNHDFARELASQGLLEYAVLQYRSLPGKKLVQILKQAEDVLGPDNEYYRNEARLRIGAIYALAGDKTRAVENLNLVLEDILKNSLIPRFLPRVGQVFEQNGLKPNAKTKKLLKEIIEEEEGE